MTKRCSTCKKTKSTKDFYKNRKKKDELQTKCKYCQKNYHNKVWYRKNKKQALEKIAERKTKVRRTSYRNVLEIYFSKGCVDCGEKDPRVLEFDHVRGEKHSGRKHDKGAGVGYMIRNGYKWSTIKREIEKCEVRCRNCHIKKTAIQFNYYEEVKDILENYEDNMELYDNEERYGCTR